MIFEIKKCEQKFELSTYHVFATSIKDALRQLEADTDDVSDVGNEIIENDHEYAYEYLHVREIQE
tara:strand:- start:376 stop:570 length:195 start_codon:yes stop_codon:yes gene_type:complete